MDNLEIGLTHIFLQAYTKSFRNFSFKSVFIYLLTCLPSGGLGTDSGLLAVSPQLTVVNLTVSSHYFLPGLQLPCLLKSITAPWPVPNYTAWWQRHTGVSSLPKVTMRWRPASKLSKRNLTETISEQITINYNDLATATYTASASKYIDTQHITATVYFMKQFYKLCCQTSLIWEWVSECVGFNVPLDT